MDTPGSIYNGDNVRVTLRGFSSDGQDLPLRNIALDNTVFDSSPLLANKASGKIPASPSYAQITMAPGPVSLANLLLAAVENGAPEFEVLDNRDAPAESAEAPDDCSQAFALFPSAASALYPNDEWGTFPLFSFIYLRFSSIYRLSSRNSRLGNSAPNTGGIL